MATATSSALEDGAAKAARAIENDGGGIAGVAEDDDDDNGPAGTLFGAADLEPPRSATKGRKGVVQEDTEDIGVTSPTRRGPRRREL
jgi:hypothetical protein